MSGLAKVFGLICLSCAAFAQPAGMQVVNLKWADAELLAALFAGEGPPSATELRGHRQDWVSNFADKLGRRLAHDREPPEPRWYYASSIVMSPREQVGPQRAGSLARFLPPGLDGPPTVLPGQNALIAKGTPAAIDQLREIIVLLDVKPRMVNVEVKLEDAPTHVTDEWGMDLSARAGDLLVATRGNAPAGGFQARYRPGDLGAAGGWDRRQSSGHALTAASITTTNNFPAIITLGRMLPVFSSAVSYDRFGNRIVDTIVEGVFVGSELFVQPRINNNDTVTMILRPTFIEATGTVMGPNGVSLPITETVGAETQVTVRDGETLQIGGFERSLRELNTRFSGFLRERNVRVRSHPQMFVTPRIIRNVE